jgi:hypothetical protein
MDSVGSIVLVLVSAALLVAAVLLARSRSGLPWPAIVVAALTSAVCFTVGGDSGQDTSGPNLATVMGSLAGLLSIAAAVISLGPFSGSGDGPGPRTPIVLAAGGVALGALGLLLTVLTG